MRTFLKIIFFPIIVIFLSILTIFSVLFVNIKNQNLYLDNLEKADIYSDLPELISETVATTAKSGIEDEISKTINPNQNGGNIEITGLYENFKPLISSSLKSVIDPIVFQTTIETNLTYWFDYLNSKSDVLSVYIPKEYIRTTLKEQVPTIAEKLVDTIEATDTCTTEQSQLLEQNIQQGKNVSIDCIPENIKQEFTDESKLKVLNSTEDIISQLEKENKLIGGEETVSIDQLLTDINQKPEEKAHFEQLTANLESFREIITTLNTVIIIVWLFIALVVALYALLTKGGILRKILSIWSILISSGTIIFVVGSIVRTIFSDQIIDQINQNMVSEGQSENMSLLIGKMLEFVSYVIQDIANPIVIIGGIMIALGFIFLALRIFLGKKIMKPVEVDKHENSSIKDVLTSKSTK